MATQLSAEDFDAGTDDGDDQDGSGAGGEEGQDQGTEDEGGSGDDADGAGDGDDDEDVITFGGEASAPEQDTRTIRELREAVKTYKRRAHDAEAKLAPVEDDLGAEPDPDDYWDNPEGLRDAIRDYDRKKARRDERIAAQTEQAQRMQARWDEQSSAFESNWAGLKVASKDEARARVEDQFDAAQQAMLIKASRGNAGFLVFLGNSPDRLAKLKELAHDPADFLVEAAVMAKEVGVSKRKPDTQPETRHRGSSGGGGGGDQKLARLEAEARKTGDRTALNRYRRNMAK